MKPLSVLLSADPYLPVPPRLYGGIERIINLIIEGLVRRGHRATLIAHPDSTAPARLIPYGVPPHRGLRPRARELLFSLLAEHDRQPQYLAGLVRLLLARGDADEARLWLGRLERVEPDSPRTRALKAELARKAEPPAT